jgi:LPXTG-site transpeptidase (sortase) family protein
MGKGTAWIERPAGRFLRLLLSVALFVTSTGIAVLAPPLTSAVAAPALSVSTSVSQTLLGDKATVRVTVTNSGDVKGYNLSIEDTLTSSKRAKYAFTSSSIAANSVSGDSTMSLRFIDIKDLAPTESYTLTLVVNIAGDPAWEVGDTLFSNARATVDALPDGTPPQYVGSAAGQAIVTPIRLTKDANQSTALSQATGALSRTYTNTVKIQNNYTNPSASVVATDTLPDGLEYLGMSVGPAPDGGFPSRNATTGATRLRWTFASLSAGQLVTLTYRVGIRYDYYGTANGGIGKSYNDTSSPWGARVPHGTGLTNTADLSSAYRGSLPSTITPTATAQARVEAAYLAMAKSGVPTNIGQGTVVSFTLNLQASQYYRSHDTTVHDVLPDGMTYNVGSAVPAPTLVTHNSSGTTDIYWDSSVVPTIAASAGFLIAFQATVDTTWEAPPVAWQPIRAGDALTNQAYVSTTWDDIVDGVRTNPVDLYDQPSVGMSTQLPPVHKQVWNPDTASWSNQVTATVGDKVLFRVRFNTNDGATPERSNITLGNITVADWLPPGCVYDGNAVPRHSPIGDFVDPSPSPPPLNVDVGNPVTLGSLTGVEWYLGDVAKAGWWETTFTATVQNVPQVAAGYVVRNFFKMTGIDTFGQEYSDRDVVTINYDEPALTLTKTVLAPAQPVPGADVTYTVTIANPGNGPAQDVAVIDTLPAGMRSHTPTVASVTLGGAPLVLDTGYKVTPAYNPASGVLTIDLHDTSAPSVDTSIPPGKNLVIKYTATFDQGVGAGSSFTNTATVGYNSKADGSGRVYPGTTVVADPNTDAVAVSVASAATVKSASPGPFTIGDSVTYTVDTTVPAGTRLYWPDIRDQLNQDGFRYVTGTAQLIDLSGAPVVPASFVATNNPVQTIAGNNSTRLDWDLATIDNTGQAAPYRFRLRYQVLVTGMEDNQTTWEFWPAGAVDRMTDTASLFWNFQDQGNGVTNRTVTANAIIDIDQPLLRTAKRPASPGPYSGGDLVDYTATITSSGYSTAHALSFLDKAPNFMSTSSILSVTHSALGALTPGVDFFPVITPPTTTTISFAPNVTLAVGQTIVIKYRMQIDPKIGAGSVLTNQADVNWMSQPAGSPNARVYNDSAAEGVTWTQDTTTANINLVSATVTKTIMGSVQPTATIGDIVTYRLRVMVPTETVLYLPSITDVERPDGMQYVPGSAALALVQGSPDTSAALVGVVSDATSPTPGSTLTFTFASPTDNASATAVVGDTAYVFDLTYQMRVTGLADSGSWVFNPAAASNVATDIATLKWNDGTATRTASSAATLTVVQPRLVTYKSLSSPTWGLAPSVTTTVQVVNRGTSPSYAYDTGPEIVDTLPAGLVEPMVVSVTHPRYGALTEPSDFTTALAGRVLTMKMASGRDDLSPGETLTIVYVARETTVAGAGSTQTNVVDANWSSEPGVWPTERVYNDIDPLEGSADTTSASMNVPAASVTKGLASASTTKTIGEVFSYVVTMTVPPGTTAYGAQVSDTVPDGLTVLSATPSMGSALFLEKPTGSTPITWTAGDVSNPPTATPTMRIAVRVDDTFFGGASLSGVAPQSSLINTCGLTYVDAPVGGTTRTALSGPITVTVVEPRLVAAKSATPATVAAGSIVSFTSTLTNTGLSPARDVTWRDRLPDALFASGSSPVLTDIRLGGSTLVEGIDFSKDFSSSPTVTVNLDLGSSPAIQPGQLLVVRYTATVPGGVTKGMKLVDRAGASYYSTLSGPDLWERQYAPVTVPATVTATAPSLVVTKTVVGDDHVQRGQTIRMRITVKNVGDATATSVVVTDTLPAPLAYATGSTVATWPLSGSSTADPAGAPGPTILFAPGVALGPSGVLTVTFDATVGVAAPLGLFVNTADAAALDLAGVSVPASTSAYNPADTDPDDSGQAIFAVTQPGVSVSKALKPGQDDHVQSGQPIGFRLTVTNTGDTPLASVPLVDTYQSAYMSYASASVAPSSTAPGTVTWNDLGAIPVSGAKTVDVTFTAGGPVPGHITDDTATVSGALDIYGDGMPASSGDATVAITRPHVRVRKTPVAGQDLFVQAGAAVAFDIRVTNDGDTTLTTVPLTDTYDSSALTYLGALPPETLPLPGSVSWNNVGPLAPGEGVTVTADFLAGASPAGNVTTDTARSSGTIDENNDPAPAATDEAPVSVTVPSLAVDKHRLAGQDPVIQVGQTVGYEIVVTNNGTTRVGTIPLDDAFDPAYLAFESSLPASDAVGPGSIHLNDIGPLAPGQSATVAVTFRAVAWPVGVTTADTATIAGITDEHGDPVPPATSTASIDITDLEIGVAKARRPGQDGHIQVGQKAVFEITIHNAGDTVITTLPVTDLYDPAYLSFDEASPAPSSTAAGSIDWGNLGPLAVDETRSIVVTFTAIAVPPGNSTVDTGTAHDVIDVNSDPVPGMSATADISVTRPGVSVTKSRAPGQDAFVQSGAPVTFKVVVTNTGDTTLTTVPLTDTFDDTALSFSTATPPQDGVSGGTVRFANVGPIAPGESTTVTLDFTALPALPGNVTTDSAAVSGVLDLNGDTTTTPSSEATVAVTRPEVSISKSLALGQDSHVQTGTAVGFSIAVTNTGDTVLSTVPLVDAFDSAYLGYSASSATPDTVSAGLLEWADLGPLAPGASRSVSVTFTALAVPPGNETTDVASVLGALDVNADPAPDASSTAQAGITRPELSISKSLHPGQDAIVQAGQTVAFDIALQNTGTTRIATLPLSDAYDPAVLGFASAAPSENTSVAGTLDWSNLGPVDPGEGVTVTVRFVALAVPAGGVTTDTATASAAADEFGDPLPTVTAEASIRVTRPDVAVTKRLSPGQPADVAAGSLVSYDIVVKNTGDTTLVTVPLIDSADGRLTFVDAAPAADSVHPDAAGTTIRFDDLTSVAGDLAPGVQTTVTVRFAVNHAGVGIPDTATVVGALDENGDPAATAHATDATLNGYGSAGLVFAKTAVPPPGTILLPGQDVRYTISFENTTAADFSGVAIVDPLERSVIYTPASMVLDRGGASTALTDATDADAGSYEPATRTVRVELGTVSAHTTGSVSFSVKVAPVGLSQAGVRNFAVAARKGETMTVAPPVIHPVDPIEIEKTGKDVNGGRLVAGDVIRWTIKVRNIGLTQTTHVTVKDDVPVGTIYVRKSIAGRGADDAREPHLVWQVGTLAVGQSATLGFSSVVEAGLPAGRIIHNQAAVSSDQSRLKRSDDPATRAAGDATLLRTGTDDRPWLGLMLLLMAAAGVSIGFGRRVVPTIASGQRRRVAVALGIALLLGSGGTAAWADRADVAYQLGLVRTAFPYASRMAPRASVHKPTPRGARLVVPRLGLDLPIGTGRTDKGLARGVWLHRGTARPTDKGNMVLAGHRVAGRFALLHVLAPGDLVVVYWNHREYDYRVRSVREAPAVATGVLRYGHAAKLTLYTCTPRFLGDRRTIVVAYPVPARVRR